MVGARCPSPEELLACLVGAADEVTAEAVIEHADACAECQAALATLDDGSDRLIARLRRPAAEHGCLSERQCSQAVARAEAIPSGPSRSGEESGARPPPEPPFWDQLGEYRLLEKLGEGGMGAVYKAWHTELDRVVALKVLPMGRLASDRAIARFRREMKAAGRLELPNIVSAYDAREIEGTYFLVMEYVDGLDLSELVRRVGSLRMADACELVRQAAVALQYAHEHGLVHRDIKPSNLMLTRDGQVKVLDLGLARFRERRPTGEEMTEAGQAMGTADYMAPEQVADSHTVDIRADVYSLGCTLYKLLSGNAPFSGPRYKSSFDKMTAHVRERVPPIKALRDDVPDELLAALDRMLAKDPAQRYATPDRVAEAMGQFVAGCDLAGLAAQARNRAETADGEGEACAATPGDECSAQVATQPSCALEPRPAPIRAAGRRKPLTVAVGLILLALGVAIALTIITIITDRGTLEIKTLAGDVKVSVFRDGREIAIVDTKTNQKIKLRTGRYEASLGDGEDGLRLSTDNFALKRGHTVIVTVSRKPAGPEYHERQAAEWAVRIGGTVGLSVAGRPMSVQAVSHLPKETFHVTSIDFVWSSHLVNDQALTQLKGLTQLQYLKLDRSQVSDAGLEHLNGLSQLRSLELAQTIVSDRGLEHLKRLTRLENLGVDSTAVGDAGLEHLKHLRRLDRLILGNTQVTDAGLQHLKGLTALRELGLSDTRVTGRGFEHLKGRAPLEVLDLNRTALDDAGLEQLGAVTGLKSLTMEKTKVTDAGLQQLQGLRTLGVLCLSRTQVGDAGLKHLKELKNLRHLDLNCTRISDEGFEHLKGLKGLRKLDIRGTRVTDAGLAALKNALPRCRIER